MSYSVSVCNIGNIEAENMKCKGDDHLFTWSNGVIGSTNYIVSRSATCFCGFLRYVKERDAYEVNEIDQSKIDNYVHTI